MWHKSFHALYFITELSVGTLILLQLFLRLGHGLLIAGKCTESSLVTEKGV